MRWCTRPTDRGAAWTDRTWPPTCGRSATGGARRGGAVLLDPMKPKLEPPGIERLKVNVIYCFQLLLSRLTCAATPGAEARLALEAVAVRTAPEMGAQALSMTLRAFATLGWVPGRGLHSFPIQLNLSSFVHRITRLSS